MKKLLILICITLQFVFANCKQTKSLEWICKDYGTSITRIVFSSNTYYFKIYFFEVEGIQTEAVHVSKATSEEFKEQFLLRCRSIFKYSDESITKCNTEWDIFIHQDYDDYIDMILNKMIGTTPLHIMYCMSHNYVRTFDYNEVTGLEINRKDYHNLPTGTYCTEFLSTNKIHWYQYYSNRN